MTTARTSDELITPVLIMICGLPASGKTTTAMRLHRGLGGVLIRSCDIYKELGIVLSDWVQRTQGFTANVGEYDRLRDEAYRRMAERVDAALSVGAPLVIVDAVHGERDKRRRLYDLCQVRQVAPLLVLCQCDDFQEVQRRLSARRGREAEPEHEASDLAVFNDIRRRWRSPASDELPDGGRPTLLVYDTSDGGVSTQGSVASAMARRVQTLLGTPSSATAKTVSLR